MKPEREEVSILISSIDIMGRKGLTGKKTEIKDIVKDKIYRGDGF
jgi:hypothetical protein